MVYFNYSLVNLNLSFNFANQQSSRNIRIYYLKFDKNNTLPYSIFLQRSSKQVLTTKSIQPLFDP